MKSAEIGARASRLPSASIVVASSRACVDNRNPTFDSCHNAGFVSLLPSAFPVCPKTPIHLISRFPAARRRPSAYQRESQRSTHCSLASVSVADGGPATLSSRRINNATHCRGEFAGNFLFRTPANIPAARKLSFPPMSARLRRTPSPGHRESVCVERVIMVWLGLMKTIREIGNCGRESKLIWRDEGFLRFSWHPVSWYAALSLFCCSSSPLRTRSSRPFKPMPANIQRSVSQDS